MVNNKKIGLALGGGGARGIAHIGVVKKLLDTDIKPDLVAGSSMGAIVAAFLALDYDWEELEKEALSYDKKKAIKTWLDLAKPGQAVLKGRKIRNFLKQKFDDLEFKDTKIPLRIVACDLESGEEVIIKKGRIVDAIYASICVPGIFSPVKIDNRILIDGSVVNPTPADIAKDMGADVIIAVDLISKNQEKIEKIPGLVTTLILAFEIIRRQSIKYKLKTFDKNTVMVKPKIRDIIDSFKFYNISKFIKSGEDATEDVLSDIEKLLDISK